MENSWAVEIYKAPTLESKWKELIDKHGSCTLDLPQEPCLHHVPLESATLNAQSTHQDYNRLMVLSCKKFRRMVVDAYIYHKHCRFRVCIVALSLCETWVPLGPHRPGSRLPLQVGLAYKKTRRPICGPNWPRWWPTRPPEDLLGDSQHDLIRNNLKT
jgi:hypothetical protein